MADLGYSDSKKMIRINGEEMENPFFQVIVNEGLCHKTFQIHEDKLMRCSPIFKAMCSSSSVMLPQNTKIIEINDIKLSTFELLVRYINGLYMNCHEVSYKGLKLDCVLDLIDVTDRYKIDTTKETCIEYALEQYLRNNKLQPSMDVLIKILKFAHKREFTAFLDCFQLQEIPTEDPDIENPDWRRRMRNPTIFGPYKWKFDDITELYLVAEHLNLTDIINNIRIYIGLEHDIINFLNCTSILANISIFSCSELQAEVKRSCLKVLQENADELFSRESLLLISMDILLDILNLEDLSIKSELNLINFIKRWFLKYAERKNPNKPASYTIKTIFEEDEVLRRNILSKLRLLTLSVYDFSSNILLTSILSVEETEIIIEAIKTKNITSEFPYYLSASTTRRIP